MKKGLLILSRAALLLIYFSSCNSETSRDNRAISTDTAVIAAGKASFNQYCSGCHNFRQDGIGPQLGGLTAKVPADWIRHFIEDPKKVIGSGDDRARQLLKKYKVVMPPFATLTENEINGIISFLNTHKSPGPATTKESGKALSNPIPGSIRPSNLAAGLKLVTQIPSSSTEGRPPLTRITKLSFQPVTGSLFIVDLRGKLYKLRDNKPIVYMDMARLKPRFIDKPGMATGFGSFAFHPDFPENGLLYTTHTEAAGSGKADFGHTDSIKTAVQWVLTEWKTDNPGADTFSGTSRELLRIDMVTGSHGVQEITFNPLSRPGDKDYGMLYIGVGDGGSVQVGYPFLVHGKEKVLGSILRIDPRGRNSANGQYGIPPDNPFARDQNAATLGEIYAYGFRNPHRITWSKSGEMLACNIGQANIESLNLIMPGHNYGWPVREGTFVFDPYGDLNKIYPLPSNDSIYKITYPVAEFDHDEGNAISGGFEYQGTAIPQLKGKFLFGDIPSGRLFYIDMADIKQGTQAPVKEWNISINGTKKTLHELCGHDRVDLRFGRDSRGELYILTKADGKVYKLVNTATKP
ncbi:MAG TPA: PQQ-dependent sugar dehydrogenase [Chitinophagaceae bacterium]|nr:PQQ-dependent sugar dehydrogenase [Chitinophagaceae bacterium]